MKGNTEVEVGMNFTLVGNSLCFEFSEQQDEPRANGCQLCMISQVITDGFNKAHNRKL